MKNRRDKLKFPRIFKIPAPIPLNRGSLVNDFMLTAYYVLKTIQYGRFPFKGMCRRNVLLKGTYLSLQMEISRYFSSLTWLFFIPSTRIPSSKSCIHTFPLRTILISNKHCWRFFFGADEKSFKKGEEGGEVPLRKVHTKSCSRLNSAEKIGSSS